jgi:MFS family permease
VLTTGFLSRLSYGLIALVVLAPPELRAWLLVALVALNSVPGAMGNVAFTSILADMVPRARQARVVALRNVLLGLTSTLAVLLAGEFLDLVPFPANYSLLFLGGFVASLLSLRHQRRFRVPRAPRPTPATAPAPGLVRRLRDFGRPFVGNRAFARFTFSAFLFHWGLFLPIPLYSIYWVRNLQATDSWIGLLAMVQNATTVLAYLFWGRAATRRGNRLVLLLGALGNAAYPLLTGLSRSVEPLLLVSVVGGVFGAALNLALFNTMLEVSPREHRPSFIAVFNTSLNVAGFVSPMIGAALSDALGIQNALFIGAGLRFLGFLLFWRLRWES